MTTEDRGPWFVRVVENKVAVGIFACDELQLADLIDEATEADACEYKKLEPGGFIFGGDAVLHEFDPEADESPEMENSYLTEAWAAVYEDKGLWRRINAPFFDNDE